MFSRFFVLIAAAVSCAGCSLVSDNSPSVAGRDSLGHQIFSVGGDRLAVLEAKANSQCPGVTRPYVQTVTGYGDDVTITYTCE